MLDLGVNHHLGAIRVITDDKEGEQVEERLEVVEIIFVQVALQAEWWHGGGRSPGTCACQCGGPQTCELDCARF